MATLAPSFASRFAIAAPIPREPPVTSAILPASFCPLLLLDRKSTRLNSSHQIISYAVFFFNDTATTEIYTLSLHDALPICFSAGALDLLDDRCGCVRALGVSDGHVGPVVCQSLRDRRANSARAAGYECDFACQFLSAVVARSEEHTSELQSPDHLVCRLLF